MGSRRGGRENSPLAGLLRRGTPAQQEAPAREDFERSEEIARADGRTAREAAGAGERLRGETSGGKPQGRLTGTAGSGAAGASPAPEAPGKKRGRPRGGRRSNPNYVQISARIHRDVRFSLEKVLVERSEREGRYVEMAEVIEDLMRFYLEHGDPYNLMGGQ